MNRRSFMKIILATATAPAIVKAENIMRIATPFEIQAVRNEFIDFDVFQMAILRSAANSMGVNYRALANNYLGVTYKAARLNEK